MVTAFTHAHVPTAKKTLEELRKVYFEMKENVFKPQSKLLPTACDTDALESLLQKTLGIEQSMNDVRKPKLVAITAQRYPLSCSVGGFCL